MTDCLWPDFDQEELEKAIIAYNQRDRRVTVGSETGIKRRGPDVYKTACKRYYSRYSCYYNGGKAGGALLYGVTALIS